ncbi:hypothetical protein RDI58_003150 [Solanum bulbocastanum]|uniref:Uncharacterized protein n=1 Tax=Solanum bulbocastanum TaxID=147425 RepID=A0AAN8YRL1_SOLBU
MRVASSPPSGFQIGSLSASPNKRYQQKTTTWTGEERNWPKLSRKILVSTFLILVRLRKDLIQNMHHICRDKLRAPSICENKLKIPPVQKPLLQLLAFGHDELRDAISSQQVRVEVHTGGSMTDNWINFLFDAGSLNQIIDIDCDLNGLPGSMERQTLSTLHKIMPFLQIPFAQVKLMIGEQNHMHMV